MTGYGRAEYSESGIELVAEIKTVNNRFLDLNPRYPRSFVALDDVIRRAVQSELKRGKADLYISYKNSNSANADLEIDVNLAKAYVSAAKTLSGEIIGIEDDFTLTSLMRSPDVITLSQKDEDIESLSSVVRDTVIKACKKLNEMRFYEGEKLKADLLERVNVVETLVNEISERAPLLSKEYYERLAARVKDALNGADYDEARLLQEVAVFADKSNIDEELTRLKSHISQFRKIACESEETGKKLDFLVQEFNREANTICSKSNDVVITDNALKLKCEIEKIREQIQNIE